MTQHRLRRGKATRGRAARGGTVLCALVACGLLAACSDDSARSTTTTSTTEPPTSSTAPRSTTTTAPPPAPQPAWVLQVGTASDDSFTSVAMRRDGPVAVGWTEGAITAAMAPKVRGTSAGGRDVLVAGVSPDGKLRSLDQAGSASADQANGVSSSRASTVACGQTDGSLGRNPAGRDDAWCAPVGTDGQLGTPVQKGGSDTDRLAGVSLGSDGQSGYAAGSTGGLFPDATDTTSGSLGGGDALVWRIDANGSPRWVRQFGTAAADAATAVATTGDDALVGGTTQGDLDGPVRGVQDGFLARFDPSGLPRWVRQFGSDGNDTVDGVATGGRGDQATETAVAVGGTDAVVPPVGGAGGASAPPRANAGGHDADAVAYDASGRQVWTAQWGTSADDEARAVAIDGSNVLVAGTTSGAMSTSGQPPGGGRDGFLSLLDLRTGDVVWTTQFGSPGDENVTGITLGGGLIVVSGTTTAKMADTAPAGGLDAFLIAFPLPSGGSSVASSL